jgi:hypothetical protein
MRIPLVKLAVLAAGMLCAAVCASAVTVTVSPDNMGDWSVVTNNGGTLDFAAYGSPVYERANAWTADDGTPLGRGSVFITLEGKYTGTGSTSWLGLDKFNGASLAGTALSSITKLEYYAYLGRIPTGSSGGDWTSWKGWYRFPHQPISLQITAESPDGIQRRQFWWMPWGAYSATKPATIRGDNSGRYGKKWLRYDCINFNNPDSGMGGRWYQPGYYTWSGGVSTCVYAEEQFLTWASLVSTYGSWKLVATSTSYDPDNGQFKSVGWDDSTVPVGRTTCTGTGKCINFEWGARKSGGTDLHLFFEEGRSWENTTQMGKGCIDRFTLGINGVEVTYDFEPAASATAPKIVELNNNAAYDSTIHQPTVWSRQMTKICGKVIPIAGEAAWFSIDDGSGKQIWGCMMTPSGDGERPANMWDGAVWSVWGYMEKMPFEPADGPWLIWTTPAHMKMEY